MEYMRAARCVSVVCFCARRLNLSVGSCSGLRLCLVSTPISSSDLSLTFSLIIAPESQPTFPTAYFPTVSSSFARACPNAYRDERAERGGKRICVVRDEPTMRCKLVRWVSGMKRTGWVMWSSRVLKKVKSLELIPRNLLAGSKAGRRSVLQLLNHVWQYPKKDAAHLFHSLLASLMFFPLLLDLFLSSSRIFLSAPCGHADLWLHNLCCLHGYQDFIVCTKRAN